jgi:rhamnose utilization protein RhaD (predicted bifunctional aldolase and dehydrogenase)/NAD(P)-dependent dehydrogenase (short-subunit alcohol dehydrogenase family)
MKNLWRDTEAEAMVAAYADRGVGRALALRVYTTRLLGGEPRLVLHGGGNTSVKTRVTDALGEDVEVLCVKGSGWDMAAIEPEGLPAVRLDALRRLRALESLGDEDMVGLVRQGLLDASAPNPSVETLLHAFLPHQYVDHTHAAAVLAVIDQPAGAERCAEVYGDAMAVVPYIKPGFPLAKAVAGIYAERPRVEGLILLKHGIFTFGESARQAYERMIAHVSRAEKYLRRARRKVFASASLPARIAPAARVAPILRGLTALVVDADEGLYRPFVLDFRGGEKVLGYVNGAELERYSQVGVVTPDHAIRTKNTPLIVPPPVTDAPDADALDAFRAGAKAALEAYVAAYRAYFARNNAREPSPKTALDAMPRVILAPGLGLFGLGESATAARIAADVAENAVEVITDAEAIGRFESISEAEVFDIEYWSLEQAKLGRAAEAPLARHVVVVTGGGRGIGAATAAAFAREGAEVAILDRDAAAAGETARRIGGATLALGCDVTRPDEVEAAFGRVCETFGGIDIVVSNAGAAWQGRIGEVGDRALRDSFELNFFAHQTVARTAVSVLRAQGIGGVLLFNASKQALDPGPDFGPYGLPKAATLALARQYAVDYGRDGIRSNTVNADRVRTGIYAGGVLEERARARGQSVAEYLAGANLLKREVKTDDVAQAFVALAKARKTTGAILTVDGGNIAAAPR